MRWTAYATPTTNLQPEKDAETKTAVSTKTYGSRSSRGDFSSSYLKIKI